MSNIRYVCLSDMHLGEEDSLLTNLKTGSSDIDPFSPSPVLIKLVECLKELIRSNDNNRKPILILNGDILELALAEMNEASMVFERFIELIMPPGDELFEQIIYVPGNHDHHLWETARETQYVEYISRQLNQAGSSLPPPWHTTEMFVENVNNPVPSNFLNGLIKRYPNLNNFNIQIAYPNFGLISGDKNKCVVFHHGHLIESIYYLMSTVTGIIFPDKKKPVDVDDIEAENFAWIDFFWSTMGRSGVAGQDIEKIYEKIGDETGRKRLIENLSAYLAKEVDVPLVPEYFEPKVIGFFIGMLVNYLAKKEKKYSGGLLSPDAEKGLWAYTEGTLREQILEEQAAMPKEVTIVFGHTHKPYQEDVNFRGYPAWVNVFNSGGWVVESVEAQPLQGGAVILVDENLDAVSLRMFNEAENLSGYSVRVEDATHAGQPPTPIFNRLSGLVNSSSGIWRDFSSTVAREIYVRQQNLRARINRRS
ncbi:MAG: metallophosphoesterase [Nitrospirae bacterium]|nr:metallophosphoesterase [Nitrospirota bacterium]